MNILFLTLVDFESINARNIYTDLLREFIRNEHSVYIVSPSEKRNNKPTKLIKEQNCEILKVQIGNIQKTNMIEKGISTLTLEGKVVNGIKKYFSKVKFDLVIYSTPPITLQKAVEYVKKRDNALTYLLLKDIFPQNAVDLGMLSKNGLKALLYQYFRNKEKRLYNISDVIGCMTPANVRFVLENNNFIDKQKLEVCPNSIELTEYVKVENKNTLKEKYGIPLNVTTFIYGGNLGKPQGIDFLIKCLDSNRKNRSVYFIIVGAGTEFEKLKLYLEIEKIDNVKLFKHLPKEEYELLVNSCDVGLIFLDKRFTIPNFPSRLLSYMHASMPVLAATDVNSDLGDILEEGKFGLWCESSNVKVFNEKVRILEDLSLREVMGINAKRYLEKNYTVQQSYEIIMKHFK